jgi:putative hydrolase of the HAD superfamily
VDDLLAAYRHRMPELTSCYPGVLDALGELRSAGWLVGIVTNGSLTNQLGKIRGTGLDQAVDGWAISGELGIRKPDQRIFAEAARRCGTSLDQGGWMVGDHPELDVAAGRAAGLRTVWIHHDRRWAGCDPEPDHRVGSAAAAARIIARR